MQRPVRRATNTMSTVGLILPSFSIPYANWLELILMAKVFQEESLATSQGYVTSLLHTQTYSS